VEGYVPITFILLDGFAHPQFFAVFSFSPQELTCAAKGFVLYHFLLFCGRALTAYYSQSVF